MYIQGLHHKEILLRKVCIILSLYLAELWVWWLLLQYCSWIRSMSSLEPQRKMMTL